MVIFGEAKVSKGTKVQQLGLEYKWIESPDERESICRHILTQLPEWFGIPESTEEYCTTCRTLTFLVASNNGITIGFIATRENSQHTVELYVLGVLSQYHRSGVGTNLLKLVENTYRAKKYRFLEVKTLDQTRTSLAYDRTRKFYEKCGFFPLETMLELWGKENPCLIMVKCIEQQRGGIDVEGHHSKSLANRTSPEIRKATIEDASRLAEIHVYGWRCAYSTFLEERYLYGKMVVSKRIEAFTNALTSNSEEVYVLVDNGSIKGFLIFGPARDRDKLNSFELWGVYVEPTFQRMGFGRHLVNYCVDQARQRGYNEIVLWVFTKNSDSRIFYERLGFTPDGRTERIDFLDQDTMRYSRDLNVVAQAGEQKIS